MPDALDATPTKPKRGGKRQGSGRYAYNDPRRIKDVRMWASARGYSPLHAAEILGQVVNEREAWHRIFSSRHDSIVLDALKFLVSMRDPKPAQEVKVSSIHVTATPEQLERARNLVRELTQGPILEAEVIEQTQSIGEQVLSEMQASPLVNIEGTGDTLNTDTVQVQSNQQDVESQSETVSDGNMLLGGEGGKNGGR